MNRYIELVKKLLEELPFFNYIVRLIQFIWRPVLDESKEVSVQLKHSLLDVVNSLGLVGVFVTAFVLLASNLNYMNAITMFNPLYVVVLCVYSSLTISLCMAIACSILCKINWARPSSNISFVFYAIFSHGLRSYAAFCFFLGCMLAYVMGQLLTSGTKIEDVLNSSIAWLVLTPVFLIWLPFRLIINPMFRFLNFGNYKQLGYIVILLIMVVSFKFNIAVSPAVGERLILRTQLCDFFKSGGFYKGLDKSVQDFAQSVMCKKSV